MPAFQYQKALIDIWFDAFPNTTLLMNFDEPQALTYGTGRGAGWRLDCLGDLRVKSDNPYFEPEMLDVYPQHQVHALAADVSDDEDRRQILDWVEDHSDGLHILVNNAGGNVTKAATEYSEDEWRKIFETNLFSAFELSRYAHPLLARHASSSIVNVGSVSGLTHVRSGVVYGMTKAAMHQMTRNLAVEWAEDGIRVNAVAPWYIRTRRTSGPLSDPDYYEEVINRTPMRRIGEPEEVAAAVGFLCLPAASYVTGECIAVDGGFLRYGF